MRANDRVYTRRTASGSYAEYALALEEEVHPLPVKVDFKQGAGILGPMGPHIMRCITRRRRALPKPSSCTGQVEV